MDKLTMNGFGHWGRASNQFFQYAFLTHYASEHNLELQLPKWVGTHLFGTDHPVVTANLPAYMEEGGGLTHPIIPEGNAVVNKDFHGYAQYHTSYHAHNQNRFVNLFQPVQPVAERLASAKKNLLQSETVIGIHLRRGDYGRRIFPIIPTEWYLLWLRHHSHRFPDFRLFISTENVSLVKEFAKYNPETTETLGIDLRSEPMIDCTYLQHDLDTKDSRAMDFYPDFYLLSQCDVILGPSSTFSFIAAMLCKHPVEYWRATLETAQFEPTDPWNAYPFLREQTRDFTHLPGIAVTKNEYW